MKEVKELAYHEIVIGTGPSADISKLILGGAQ